MKITFCNRTQQSGKTVNGSMATRQDFMVQKYKYVCKCRKQMNKFQVPKSKTTVSVSQHPYQNDIIYIITLDSSHFGKVFDNGNFKASFSTQTHVTIFSEVIYLYTG